MRALIVLLKLMQLPREVLVSEDVEFFTAAPSPLVPHLIPKTKAPATLSARYGAVCCFDVACFSHVYKRRNKLLFR